MKQLLFSLLILFMSVVEAKTSRFNLEMATSVQMLNVETQQSTSTSAASAGFTVLGFSPIIQYSLFPKVTALFSYESLTDMATQAKFTGTRVGIRYFLKTDNVVANFQSDVISFQKFPNFGYYADASYSSLSLDSDTLSINFNGFHIGGGAFFHLYQQYYVIGDISYKAMTSGAIRTLSGLSFMLGIGTYFY